jgi:replicative DNA helicase
MVDGKAIAARVFGVVQQWHERRGLSGLTTGFDDLDLLTTGLQPGDLILLAARPSMGKSALVGQMAYHIAVREQQPVAFFSLEMSVESIGVRMACAAARLDLHRARHGWLRELEMQRFGEVLKPIEDSALYLDEGVTVRTADIRRKAKHLQAQRGLSLIIIDYLQLLDASGRKSNTRNDDVSAISRALKVLGGELHVPVVALSQLNRTLERRPDKRPILSDLRDSGSLEQDADLVMFLYRDEVYNQTAENVGQAELILAKQRNGPPGTVHLHWTASSLRFDDVTQEAGDA